jgi:hypothetical protein
MFASIGALMSAEAKKSERDQAKMGHEASLLNIEKVTRLGALLQMPGTTAEFKVTIQAQMEQIAKEMIEAKQAAPPQPIDTSPGAPPAPAGLLSPPQGSSQPLSSNGSPSCHLLIDLEQAGLRNQPKQATGMRPAGLIELNVTTRCAGYIRSRGRAKKS